MTGIEKNNAASQSFTAILSLIFTPDFSHMFFRWSGRKNEKNKNKFCLFGAFVYFCLSLPTYHLLPVQKHCIVCGTLHIVVEFIGRSRFLGKCKNVLCIFYYFPILDIQYGHGWLWYWSSNLRLFRFQIQKGWNMCQMATRQKPYIKAVMRISWYNYIQPRVYCFGGILYFNFHSNAVSELFQTQLKIWTSVWNYRYLIHLKST